VIKLYTYLIVRIILITMQLNLEFIVQTNFIWTCLSLFVWKTLLTIIGT